MARHLQTLNSNSSLPLGLLASTLLSVLKNHLALTLWKCSAESSRNPYCILVGGILYAHAHDGRHHEDKNVRHVSVYE